jgi:hypothetical protein
LQLQQANIEEMSEEESEQLIVDDRGEEQEGVDDNQAFEQRLTKTAIPNVNKAVTMAVELTCFITDTVPLTEGRTSRGTEGLPKENVSTNCYFLIFSEY